MTKHNTTVYLCADTGMDMENSIWWDKFAYMYGPYQYQGYWHHVKGLWFKAHACCAGFWYLNFVSDFEGYVDVGRYPLNDNTIPMYEEGLWSDVNNEYNVKIPFADVLLGRVDYIYYTNGLDDDASRGYFGFVTRIESIDFNCARVHFMLDAIETYGQYFNFGPCMVDRDMQHLERKEDNTPNLECLNHEKEPMYPSPSDYVFQKMAAHQPVIEYTDFEEYDTTLVMSDVSLQMSDIKPNAYYGGLPSFRLSPETYERNVTLGVGVYYMPKRQCEVLDLLGSYNAAEHLLYTYMVPSKILINFPNVGDNPVHMGKLDLFIDPKYKGQGFTLKLPIKYNDNQMAEYDQDGYEPINLKSYYAPYSYCSITDRQGGSKEYDFQSIIPDEPTPQNFFNLHLFMELSIAPNTGSCLYVTNTQEYEGGLYDPLTTLLQMPSYSMTPNNSGYNTGMVNAVVAKKTGLKQVLVGAPLAALGNVLAFASRTASIGAAAAGDVVTAAMGSTGTYNANNLANTGLHIQNRGVGNILQGMESQAYAEANKVFGLPKATGGLAQGFTTFSMNHAGFDYFFVHLRTELIKKIDTIFSIFGYNQGEFRYPNINTRRRWTYVKCQNVNIIPKGHQESVPHWAMEQIKQRLMNGITFWNVRWALLGDDDANADPHVITNWDSSQIQDNKGHKFVRNYGNLETMEYMKENMSVVGGYCDYYNQAPYADGLTPPT